MTNMTNMTKHDQIRSRCGCLTCQPPHSKMRLGRICGQVKHATDGGHVSAKAPSELVTFTASA